MVQTDFVFNSIYKRGYVTFQLPDSLLSSIKQKVQYHIDNNFKFLDSYNQHLVGLINDEFDFSEFSEPLFPYVEQAAYVYIQQYNSFPGGRVVYSVDQKNTKDIWINFQKKNEFNPPHNHNGNFSFVIWINIPFDVDEELKAFNSATRDIDLNTPGSFSFLYPDHFNRGGIAIEKIPIDKSVEGKGILFESGTMHMVHPFFTSDDYRVSIAGNLEFING